LAGFHTDSLSDGGGERDQSGDFVLGQQVDLQIERGSPIPALAAWFR
jgi:hypothetical protein